MLKGTRRGTLLSNGIEDTEFNSARVHTVMFLNFGCDYGHVQICYI